jgi:hypothetical protein
MTKNLLNLFIKKIDEKIVIHNTIKKIYYQKMNNIFYYKCMFSRNETLSYL